MRDQRTLFAFSLATLLLWSGCGGAPTSNQSPPPVLNTIIVSPADYSINLGFSLKLTATGNYSDGSMRDLTNSALWTSTNDSNGLGGNLDLPA